VTITGGTSTTSGGTGGNVVLKAGPNTGSGTKGKVLIKDAGGTIRVTVDETQFKVDTVAIDMDAAAVFAMTGAGGVTIDAGSNNVVVNSHLVMGTNDEFRAEGGLLVGQTCAAATCDSGSATIARANIARIMKAQVPVDCSSTVITPGGEKEFTLVVSSATDGMMVDCYPPNETGGGSTKDIIWNSFACTDCLTSGAAGITLRIGNIDPSANYDANTNWQCMIWVFQ
jgi:hypothetical protein